jgi:hypothetical protein
MCDCRVHADLYSNWKCARGSVLVEAIAVGVCGTDVEIMEGEIRMGASRVGWNQIRSTPLMGMNLDRITTEALDSLALAGSPSYVNQAFRTLRRLLGKAC